MVRKLYVPMGDKVWLANFAQRGRGLGAYAGDRFQRGYGIGSIFSSLLRSIMPVAKTVGRQALRTGAEVAQDYLQGSNVKSSIRARGKQGARRLAAKGMRAALNRAQKGRGGLGVRSRPSAANSIKGTRKVKKPTSRKKKKR